ncbi:MAG: phosphatidate cytidylyltransferase [Sphingorhabdus sp.]
MSEVKGKSDLKVRTFSAIVMVAVTGGALWAGGLAFPLFVGLVGLGLLWELWGLVSKITKSFWGHTILMLAGVIYIGTACFTLITLRSPFFGTTVALMIIGAVIATDIGAYFVGRNIGGPKIAPRISPSKTWSGLVGGMLASGLTVIAIARVLAAGDISMGGLYHFGAGAAIAMVAQIGDFLQSWMKRRAGVKDSGNLIPGHGGLFDRTDGLIAVLFITGVIALVAWVIA